MWLLFVSVIITLFVIKLTRLALFWRNKGVPYESFPHYVYRVLWLFNTRRVPEVVAENHRRYGPVYGTYRGLQPSLMVSDLDIFKDVTIKQFHNFFKRSFEFTTGDPLWDNMLTHLPYDEWKGVRTVMGYTFTTSKMKGMIMKLDQVAKRLMGKLEEQTADSGKAEIVVKDDLKCYGLDSMLAIAFGLDMNCIDNPDNPFVKYGSDLFRPGLAMFLFFVAPKLIRYIPFISFPPKETSEFFDKIAKQVLDDKRKHLDEVVKNGTADIIDLHMLAQRQDGNDVLTDKMLISQAFLFLIGGLDISVLSLKLTTYYLTVHPEAQRRAYEEVMEVMGGRTEVQYDDVQRMKFLEASIHEAFRATPSSFFVDRICSEPAEVAGIKFEKGMVVEFMTTSFHQNPKFFPQPDKYMPERFLKNEGASQQELGAYIQFGDGPKNCVGRRLALMNMQVLLANLLTKFRLEPCGATPSFPLKIKKGLQLNDITEEEIVVRLAPRGAATKA